MIIMAQTRKEAARIATAMLTMTGYRPTIFVMDNPRQFRVQENEYGQHWGKALTGLLTDGLPPTACTHSHVAAKMADLGL